MPRVPGARFSGPNRFPSGRRFNFHNSFFYSPFFFGGFSPFLSFGFYGYPYYYPYPGWDVGWDYGYTYGGGSPYGYPYEYGYSGPPGSYQGEYTPDRRPTHEDMGSLDLDLSPSDTQVYLNGQYIGVVDDFDGWPQYLWLEKGTYDIVFFKDGYRTIARQVTVYPGVRVTFNDRMEKGESVRPEDLATKTHERRDSRINYEEQRNQRLERQGYSQGSGEEGSDWRDRVRSERGQVQAGGDQRDRPDRIDGSERAGQAGRLRLKVDPDDASIYLDGRFVGTAGELAERGLPLSLGRHRIAVVRPGRKSSEQDFEVTDGNDVDLRITLDSLR